MYFSPVPSVHFKIFSIVFYGFKYNKKRLLKRNKETSKAKLLLSKLPFLSRVWTGCGFCLFSFCKNGGIVATMNGMTCRERGKPR
jgi:hypothetical protein